MRSESVNSPILHRVGLGTQVDGDESPPGESVRLTPESVFQGKWHKKKEK